MQARQTHLQTKIWCRSGHYSVNEPSANRGIAAGVKNFRCRMLPQKKKRGCWHSKTPPRAKQPVFARRQKNRLNATPHSKTPVRPPQIECQRVLKKLRYNFAYRNLMQIQSLPAPCLSPTWARPEPFCLQNWAFKKTQHATRKHGGPLRCMPAPQHLPGSACPRRRSTNRNTQQIQRARPLHFLVVGDFFGNWPSRHDLILPPPPLCYVL